MKMTRDEVRPWFCWILAVAAILVARPREAHAGTFTPSNVTMQVTFSTDSTCGNADDQPSLSVAANTTYYVCHKVTNASGITLSNIVIDDPLAPSSARRTLPSGVSAGGGIFSSSTFFISQQLTATATTAYSFTVSGTDAAGNTFLVGPSASSTVTLKVPGTFIPVLPIKLYYSTDATCGNADDQSPLTVTAGTLVYLCYRVENAANNGYTLFNVQVQDPAITVPGTRTLPSPSFTFFKAGPIVATGNEDHSFTVTGTNAAGDTFLRGPDFGSLIVVTPKLAVEKTVSLDGTCPGVERVTVLAGTHVTYCYTVTNTGGVGVNGITLSDSNVQLDVGNLAIGQSWSGSAPFTATSDTDTQAIATGVETISGGTVVSPPDDASIDVILPALSIAVTVSASGQCPGDEVINVLAGSPVTWCYTVTNTGDSDVDNIVVTDNQYGQVPGSITALFPGESATLSLAVSASNDVTLLASAAGTVPFTGTPVVSPQDPAVVNVVRPNVDVDVTVSTDGQCPGADSVTVVAGSSVVYCYLVTNNGDDTLAEVRVFDLNGALLTTLNDLEPGATVLYTSDPMDVLGDQLPGATANATDIYGYPATDSDTAIVHALFDRLTVQKTVSLDGTCPGSELVTVLAGTPVTYCYVVTNPGDTRLEGVVVNDNGVFVDAGNLAPGQSIVVSAGVLALTDQNTDAIAEGSNSDTGRLIESLPDNAAVDVVAPALSIQKTASLDGTCPGSETVTVLAGTTVTYCYIVSNVGDTDVGDIVVSDHDATISVGALAAGASTIVSSGIVAPTDDVSTTAVASGTDTATWTHVASPPDGALIDVIHPALSIATSVSLDGTCPGVEVVNVLSGTGVTWCYVVTNTGDVALSGVHASDDTYGAVPGTAVQLAAGASTTFVRHNAPVADVTIVASSAGTEPVTGTAVISNQDPAVVNVVHPSIDVDVTVSTNGACPGVDSITVTPGTSVKTCYSVTNLGDDALTNVVVTSPSGQVLFTIPSLGAGATSVFSTTAPVTQNITPTAIANATDVYGFPVTDSDSALAKVVSTNLHIVKTGPASIVQDPPSGCHSGTPTEAIDYTITVTNLGATTATSVVVTDPLPAGSSYVGSTLGGSGGGCGGGSGGSSGQSCSYANGKVTCQLGSVAPGQTVTFVIKTKTTVASGSVSNTATVSSASADSDLSDNTSTWVTRVTNGATRTIGFWGNHPTFMAACLAANGGVINLGFAQLRNETHDNEIDVDSDNRVETGIALAMGVLNLNPAKLRNGQSRTTLGKARATTARQVLAAICNSTYLGTPPSFDLQAAIATLAGTNVTAINNLNTIADAFNNSGDDRNLSVDPGAANSKYPWDDLTDSSD